MLPEKILENLDCLRLHFARFNRGESEKCHGNTKYFTSCLCGPFVIIQHVQLQFAGHLKRLLHAAINNWPKDKV